MRGHLLVLFLLVQAAGAAVASITISNTSAFQSDGYGAVCTIAGLPEGARTNPYAPGVLKAMVGISCGS